MKALMLKSPGELVMCDAPVPEPGENELLIRTKAATICTSDLIDIKENPFGIELPVIIGHEGAGVVVKAGARAEGFSPGDRVAAHPVMHCGKCASCARGLYHLCDDMEHLGLNRGGTFAEYFVIRADRARLKPESLPFEVSALMEPVCVCLEALDRANVAEGSNVLIIGDGPFGIIISRLAAARKPACVVMLGRHEYRLGKASEGGAVVAVNEKKCGGVIEEVMAAAGGCGFDSCVVCAADAGAVETGVAALRSRGTLCLFSGIGGRTPVDLFKVHVKELTIAGSCNDTGYLDEALRLLADKTLDIGGVITHRFPFERWEDAFWQARDGKQNGLKVCVDF